MWVYCLGHARASGNEQADRLASTADITSGLQLGTAEVLRGLRNFLNMDRPEHHSIDRLKESRVEKGSRQHSTLWGREQSVFNQTSIDNVLSAILGRLLRDREEHIWVFLRATKLFWAETETVRLEAIHKLVLNGQYMAPATPCSNTESCVGRLCVLTEIVCLETTHTIALAPAIPCNDTDSCGETVCIDWDCMSWNNTHNCIGTSHTLQWYRQLWRDCVYWLRLHVLKQHTQLHWHQPYPVMIQTVVERLCVLTEIVHPWNNTHNCIGTSHTL